MEGKSQSTPEQAIPVPPPAVEAAPAEPQGPQENKIFPGTVVKITNTGAHVSFGWKCDGIVPIGDFEKVHGEPAVKVGDQFEVLVEVLGDEPERTVLSKDKAAKLRLWEEIIKRCAGGGPVEGVVVARIPGGYSVDIGTRAFLPGSQADLRRLDDPDSLLGETLTFGVSEFDKRKGKIVLSRRALMEKEQKAKRAALLANLAEGQVLEGTVRTLMDYGAFVDIGGVDGLIHVSELSWGRVGHPRDVLEVGEDVTVKVLKFDAATGKIGLGLKQLQEDPWAKAAQNYPPGDRVSGKVVGFAEFGAFIALEPGLEGLVHVSELSWTKRVKHPSHELKMGQEIEAVVLDVDVKARRLSLGMRQLQENPWASLEAKFPVGTRLKRKIKSVTDFGVFLEVTDGIDGLVHVSELSWSRKVEHPSDLYKAGDEVEAIVLKIDAEHERFSLGIKQLLPDPWMELVKAHPVGSKLKGKVTKVMDFGAFVEVEPGIEGLVHVSELSTERVESAASFVKAGQELEVQVLDVDASNHKISLSVRALSEVSGEDYRDYMEKMEKEKVGTTLGDKLAGKVKK